MRPSHAEYSRAMSSETGTPRLGILLAMAMFVFVIDTSLMNVSISAVVRDLDTTVSGVQSAVAAGGPGLGRLHPDRQQARRPLWPQAGVCHRPRPLRRGRPRDGVRAGPGRDHRLLGGDRGPRCCALSPGDAVPHPRQLRGEDAGEGVCADRGLGRHRRGDRPPDRRLLDHAAFVACRIHARGGHHRRRVAGQRADP